MIWLSLFLTLAHAEWFLVPEVGNPSKLVVIEAKGFVPKDVVTIAPTDGSGHAYPVESLDIVEEVDPNDPSLKVKRAFVNEAKLKAYQEAQKKIQEDAQKAKDKEALDKATRLDKVIKECAKQTSAILLSLCDILLNDVPKGASIKSKLIK